MKVRATTQHPTHWARSDTKHGHKNPMEHGAHSDMRERMGRGADHEAGKGAPHDRDRSMEGDPTGRDAAEMRPFLIPDYELLPRDDSGGPEWQPYTQEWGDGGYITGPKAHLMTSGGRDDPLDGDEQDSTVGRRNQGKGGRNPPSRVRDEARD